LIKIKNFEIIRDSFKLGPINLTANDGQKVLVYGLNGSGKTTMLLGLLGELKTSGSFTIDDIEISSLPIEKRGIAYQPATPAVIPNLKVKEILELANQKQDEILLEKLNLKRLFDVKGSKLSAGQARLTQIAAVLLSNAKIILMDEPFAFLSEELIYRVFELMMADKRIIIVTSQKKIESFDVFLHLGDRGASGSFQLNDY
jgi:ABC-type multidrug transport system ATPase subunit